MKKSWTKIILEEIHHHQKVLHLYEKLGYNFYFYYLYLRQILTQKPIIEHFTYLTNTTCTLKCKECHSYMPYYKPEAHYTTDFETFKTDIDKLLKSVDYILSFRLQGGETLLVKDLAKITEYACKQKQIQHIQIITNGTIIPSKELIKAMQNPKVVLSISDYSINKDIKHILKNNEILKISKENNINVKFWITLSSGHWFAKYSIKPKMETDGNFDEDLAKKNLSFCYCFGIPKAIILSRGKLHICPPSIYNIHNNKNYEFLDDEVVDIINTDTKSLTKKIKKMLSKKYYELCSRCNAYDSKNIKSIPGLQISASEEKVL